MTVILSTLNAVLKSGMFFPHTSQKPSSLCLNKLLSLYTTLLKTFFPNIYERVKSCTLRCQWCDLKQIEMHALSLVSGMPGYTQAYITQISGASGLETKLERGAGSIKVLMKT